MNSLELFNQTITGDFALAREISTKGKDAKYYTTGVENMILVSEHYHRHGNCEVSLVQRNDDGTIECTVVEMTDKELNDAKQEKKGIDLDQLGTHPAYKSLRTELLNEDELLSLDHISCELLGVSTKEELEEIANYESRW